MNKSRIAADEGMSVEKKMARGKSYDDEAAGSTTAGTKSTKSTKSVSSGASSTSSTSTATDAASAGDSHQDATGLDRALGLMEKDGMSEIARAAFRHLYSEWQKGESGIIHERRIRPLDQSAVPSLSQIYEEQDREIGLRALKKTAFLKLNGGLGTSMGLSKAKSLLPVRIHKGRNLRFLDIILGQVMKTRESDDVRLPLILMDSYRTSHDTLEAVSHNRRFSQDDFPLEILQHREPKILEETGEPVSWPDNPDLQWCPPGHGDVFATLQDSGMLDRLLDEGMEYLFISNSDNLGARPSATIAGFFEQSGAPFMVEVARKTPLDIKGGQFVYSRRNGRLMLREMSQVSDEDLAKATDIRRHPFFNTNNIWVRLEDLRDKLAKFGGILPLPVIVNHKTVDPTDSSSPKVVQLETAMGAAIGLFDGAICLEVDRPRFLPVKTTNDLYIMRSDRFHMTDQYEMEDGDYHFPPVDLDTRYYRNIADFNERFPYSVPSIAAASSVTVKGDWTFGEDVSFYSDARLEDRGFPSYVPNGSFVGPNGIEPDDWN